LGSIAKNKKARFNYTVEDTYEAGIILLGTEVKSCLNSNVDLSDGYVDIGEKSVVLKNVHIAKYENAGYADHAEKRDRVLLLNKNEILRLNKKIKEKGYTLIPLSMYFSKSHKIKVEVGLCKGKKLYDKREALKKKQMEMDVKREMKI